MKTLNAQRYDEVENLNSQLNYAINKGIDLNTYLKLRKNIDYLKVAPIERVFVLADEIKNRIKTILN